VILPMAGLIAVLGMALASSLGASFAKLAICWKSQRRRNEALIALERTKTD
jgi:hypothetical protein